MSVGCRCACGTCGWCWSVEGVLGCVGVCRMCAVNCPYGGMWQFSGLHSYSGTRVAQHLSSRSPNGTHAQLHRLGLLYPGGLSSACRSGPPGLCLGE